MHSAAERYVRASIHAMGKHVTQLLPTPTPLPQTTAQNALSTTGTRKTLNHSTLCFFASLVSFYVHTEATSSVLALCVCSLHSSKVLEERNHCLFVCLCTCSLARSLVVWFFEIRNLFVVYTYWSLCVKMLKIITKTGRHRCRESETPGKMSKTTISVPLVPPSILHFRTLLMSSYSSSSTYLCNWDFLIIERAFS